VRYELSKRGRTVLLFLSAANYTAWFSGLGERGDAQGMTGASAFLTLERFTPRSSNIALAISRDPFDGLRKPITLPKANTTTAGTSEDPLVPDIAVGSLGPAAVRLAVHATITGPNPVAYVGDGASMDIVRVGDTLGGQRVAAIDLRGIAFTSGARLDLPDGQALKPQPPRQQNDRTVLFRLSDLQRLFGTRQTTQPQPDGSPTAAATTAQPSAAVTDEPPAPLRTADARGFAVGTNPVPDSGSATPEPYPYPYAPPR
jgi:hypothetical protein